MSTLSFLLDILKFVFSGLVLFFIIFYYLKDTGFLKQSDKLSQASHEHLIPLRLQAYERLVLFIERINPSSLLLRLHVPGMSAQELQHLVLQEIRAEFQHNITQQIYVGRDAWRAVGKIKEDTIVLVSRAASGLPPDTTSAELSRAILTHLSTLKEDPYELALTVLKDDMQTVF